MKFKQVLKLKEIARHPVFGMAEQAPVFLINNKVYSVGEGKVQDRDNFYEQKKIIKSTRILLTEVGNFESLDELMLDRAQLNMREIGEDYVKDAQKEINVLRSLDRDLDVPQLIFKQVFPYFQDENYTDKVSELLGIEKQKEKQATTKAKAEITPKLEQIASEVEAEVKSLISQIEQEGQELTERTKKQEKLDDLFDYKEVGKYTGNFLLGRTLSGKNVAIVERKVYDLIAGSDGCKRYLQIDGKKFSLVERKEQKREPKTDFEIGDKIRMNAGASEQYSYTKEGSEGEIKRFIGDGKFDVEFTKLTGGRSDDVLVSYDVHKKYMENLSEVVAGDRPSSQRDLEDRFLTELGKKIRIDALKEHFSKDKIIDLLRTQDAELLSIAGRKEYKGDGYGFVQNDGGDYYAYIDFPTIAIKSEEDGNYYLYNQTRIGLRVSKEGKNLSYDGNMFMIENNGHPYVHNKNEKFAEICQGKAAYVMPTSGRDTGEVIAKRLRKMKEVLMFGYAWKYFDPVIEGNGYGKDYESHRKELSELKKMNIPAIVKGELIK